MQLQLLQLRLSKESNPYNGRPQHRLLHTHPLKRPTATQSMTGRIAILSDSYKGESPMSSFDALPSLFTQYRVAANKHKPEN